MLQFIQGNIYIYKTVFRNELKLSFTNPFQFPNTCILYGSNLIKTRFSSQLLYYIISCVTLSVGGRRDHDRMVVEFTTTCAISAYHH
jgi:hypothetical protein